MKSEAEEGRAWFTLLVSLPAILAWIGYGLAWLLGPHLVIAPEPLLWAGYAAGGYYAIIIFIWSCGWAAAGIP